MTDAEVVALVCQPEHSNSTVTLNHTREQGVYASKYLYFEDGRLVSMQFIH